jgi:hypothetical protein
VETIRWSTTASRTALFAMCVATGFSSNCEAQTNSPVVKAYAYEREVIGGIPDGPPGVGTPSRQLRYFIYLETVPKAEFTIEGVWIKSRFHTVATELKKAPVTFESPVKLAQPERSVAVPATTNTVTEISVKDPVSDKTPDSGASALVRENDAVVQLRYGGKTVHVPITKFERRDPIYMR